MKLEVVYEDTDLLVINKPFGLVVNRADTVNEWTVQDWVREDRKINPARWGAMDDLYTKRDGICHRIDKETSGCLLVAKNAASLRFYLKEFKERRINKTYYALVHGWVDPEEGEVVLPMKRSRFEREKWQVRYDGKTAWTIWRVLGRYKYPETSRFKDSLSYLEIDLKTGRTHQIRVHMSFLGWPLFADEKYLNSEIGDKDRMLLSHHFLHSGKVSFATLDGDKKTVEVTLPEDCQKLLGSLVLE